MSLFQEEHRIFQQSVAKFSNAEILPVVDAWEKQCDFPSAIFEKLGANGFLGIFIEEAFGGVGGSYMLAAAWCEQFGRIPAVGFTTGVNMHALVVLPALQRYGTEETKQRWLQAGVEGKAIGAYAFTEPDAGSDLTRVKTKAVEQGDHFVLNGSKIFITNGKRADFILVLAKTAPDKGYDGFSTFLVDTKSPGFTVNRTLSKLGWHSSDTAELSFVDVKVPKSCLLGELNKGWYQAMTSLEWERLMLTLAAIGGASQCLEDTVTYINQRTIFGQTVGSFERNRTLLARRAAQLQAARALCHQCVRMLEAKQRCRREVSLAKRNICELAIEIADECLQLHGGFGYTTEFKPERWLRDLRLNTIGGGASEVMARIAMKEVFDI